VVSKQSAIEAELVAAMAVTAEAMQRMAEARADAARCARELADARNEARTSDPGGDVSSRVSRARLVPLARASAAAEQLVDDAAVDVVVAQDNETRVRRVVESERTRAAEPRIRERYQRFVEHVVAALEAYEAVRELEREVEDHCPLPHQVIGGSELVWELEQVLAEARDVGYPVAGRAVSVA
jgi:hypothetical protein